MLLNATKGQGYSFYCFWVIKGKPTGEVKLPTPQTWVNSITAMSISFRFSNLYTTSIGETYSAEFFFICHVIHVGMAAQGKKI